MSSYKSITGTVLPVCGTGFPCRKSHCSAVSLSISGNMQADTLPLLKSIPVPIIYLHLKIQTNNCIGNLKRNISFFCFFYRAGGIRWNQAMPSLNFSDFKVFTISMVTVIGPTPPGTGVM